MTQTLLLGGVEAGGTKFVCGVADGDGRILEQVRVATTTPDETLAAVDAFFARTAAAHGPLAALGVCSFGPLSLRPDAPDYGAITTTPKPGWSGANLLSHLRRTADTPTEGVRTPERQRDLYAQGRTKSGKIVTKTLTSNHFKHADGYGHAVDLTPYPVDYEGPVKFPKHEAIAKAMKAAAAELGVKMQWGGDWKGFIDRPHFELKS